MPYQVYLDPDNKPERRQHVEECPNNTKGKEIIDYITARLPKDDRIFGEWGTKQPNVAPYDRRREYEPANLPVTEGEG